MNLRFANERMWVPDVFINIMNDDGRRVAYRKFSQKEIGQLKVSHFTHKTM